MKVFVKRYPEKGELPKHGGYFLSNIGLIQFFAKDNSWLDDEYSHFSPNYWLEEIELPNAEDIRREALGPFKEKDLEDQYGDFIQDDIDTFTKGANYILNILKQK